MSLYRTYLGVTYINFFSTKYDTFKSEILTKRVNYYKQMCIETVMSKLYTTSAFTERLNKRKLQNLNLFGTLLIQVS